MAIVLVTSASGGGNSSGGFATSAVDTTGANFIVVSVSSAVIGGSTVPTLSDNKSNTWTSLTGYTVGASRHTIFYVLSPTVGTGHTFTTSGTNIYPAIIVRAFSGVSSYDSQQSGATGTSSPLATGSVTPSANGALILTGICGDPGATHSYPSGFTGGINIPQDSLSGFNIQGSSAYLIQTTAAAINPSWSWTGSHTSAATSVAVFKETTVSAAASVRVSQHVVEILSLPVPVARVSQHVVEILSATTAPAVTESTQFMIVMP